jgi:hypothetical protein
MRKHYVLSLTIPEESKFNEEEFIQETIRPIPNGITIAMREIYPPSEEQCKMSKETIKEISKSNSFKDVLLKVKELLEGIEDPYPRDIFPEIKEKDFPIINEYLQNNHSYSLDRLSAHIMRIARKNFKEEVLTKLKEEDVT